MRRTSGRGVGLIEILVVLVIIYAIYMMMLRFTKKPAINAETQDVLTTEHLDTSNYGAVLKSAGRKLKDIARERPEYE